MTTYAHTGDLPLHLSMPSWAHPLGCGCMSCALSRQSIMAQPSIDYDLLASKIVEKMAEKKRKRAKPIEGD